MAVINVRILRKNGNLPLKQSRKVCSGTDDSAFHQRGHSMKVPGMPHKTASTLSFYARRAFVLLAILLSGLSPIYFLHYSVALRSEYRVESVSWERSIFTEKYIKDESTSSLSDIEGPVQILEEKMTRNGIEVRYLEYLWKPHRQFVQSGNNNAPVWPIVEIGKGEKNREDRIYRRTEDYILRLRKITGSEKLPDTWLLKTSEKFFRMDYVPGRIIPFRANRNGKFFLRKGENRLDTLAAGISPYHQSLRANLF